MTKRLCRGTGRSFQSLKCCIQRNPFRGRERPHPFQHFYVPRSSFILRSFGLACLRGDRGKCGGGMSAARRHFWPLHFFINYNYHRLFHTSTSSISSLLFPFDVVLVMTIPPHNADTLPQDEGPCRVRHDLAEAQAHGRHGPTPPARKF